MVMGPEQRKDLEQGLPGAHAQPAHHPAGPDGYEPLPLAVVSRR